MSITKCEYDSAFNLWGLFSRASSENMNWLTLLIYNEYVCFLKIKTLIPEFQLLLFITLKFLKFSNMIIFKHDMAFLWPRSKRVLFLAITCIKNHHNWWVGAYWVVKGQLWICWRILCRGYRNTTTKKQLQLTTVQINLLKQQIIW